MKKLLVLVLALTMVFTAVTSASAITIAFSQIGQESDWRTANTDSVTAAIEGHEGWEFVYSDGQQKQENQIQALRNFITQGVDYILFTGVVTSGWDEVLSEVNEAEIPLILLDRIPDCADKIDYVAAFGGDFPLEGRRQVQELMHFFHKYVPGCENATLMGTGAVMGIRESRHITGDYVLPVQSLIDGIIPDDVVLLSANSIDVHGAQGGPAGGLYMPIKKNMYGLPYRCLVPKDIDGLHVTGRCISADSAAAGAVRAGCDLCVYRQCLYRQGCETL